MSDQATKALLIIAIVATAIVVIVSLSFDKLFIMKPFVYSSAHGHTKRYIDWITPHAKTVGAKYGIPWQAIVVQTALETAWGKSSLLTKYNNFGGIKSVRGDQSISLGTSEFVNGKYIRISDGFAVFKNPADGLAGYGNFFHRNPRYSKALNYPNDPYQFIAEVKKAGYATDPSYTAKLHGMLNKYF